jgi:hypothetical protein
LFEADFVRTDSNVYSFRSKPVGFSCGQYFGLRASGACAQPENVDKGLSNM